MSEVLLTGSRTGDYFIVIKNGVRRYLTLDAYKALMAMDTNGYDLYWEMAVTGPVAEKMGKEWRSTK